MSEADELTLEDQVGIIITSLGKKHIDRRSTAFKITLEWLKRWPRGASEDLKDKLALAFCESANLSRAGVIALIEGIKPPAEIALRAESEESRLWKLIPRGGFVEWYCDFTRCVESPLSYHLTCALAVIGTALGRRVYKPMGHFNIYPNICAILVGPPARVKKTSAVNIARDQFIIPGALVPVISDKITAEALVTNLAKNGGTQFLPAPELGVFFGKQKYLEGLVGLMLRLLDDPDEMRVTTLARQEEIITDVALTILGASATSLLVNSTPTDVTSSGFLSRFLVVVEQDTPRCFPESSLGPPELKDKLARTLKFLQGMEGEVDWGPGAWEVYRSWYHQRKVELSRVESETSAEMMGRGSTHLLRLAMNIHCSQCGDLKLCPDCITYAADILGYYESHLPDIVTAIDRSQQSRDSEYLVGVLRRFKDKGTDHSSLLRRVSSRLNAVQMKAIVGTLEEMGRLRVVKSGEKSYYFLVEGEGEKGDM